MPAGSYQAFEEALAVTTHQFAGNDDALNMAGAFVDLQALDVSVVALNGIFVGVAAIAVQQHGLIGGAHGGFGGEELGNGGGSGGGLSLVYRAAWTQDCGLPATRATSTAKLLATEAAVRAANAAVLLHGNRGYSNEYPVERYLRDIKGLQIYEGTSHIQRIIIARELVGRG